MADTKITQLQPPQSPYSVVPATDVLPIVVIADPGMAASGSTRKVTVNQILGSGGTATLASATITGDLTVDTNVLKVDTTLNRVGVLNASPGVAFHIGTTGGTNRFAINTAFTSGGDIQLRRGAFIGFSNAADSGNSEYLFANAGALDFGINGSTAMTLNATGLSVGVVPYASWPATSKALQLGASSAIEGRTNDGSRTALYSNTVWNGTDYVYQNTAPASYYLQSSGVHSWFSAASGSGNISFGNAKMTLDAAGNVGIGVTPSAVNVGRGLEVGAVGNGLWCNNSSYNQLLQNAYNTSISATGWRYAAAASTPAVRVQLGGGEFNVYNAVAGTAGTDLTWTPRLTLDASGNLLVGNTGNPNTARAYFRYDTLTTQPVINSASIVAASTAWSHFIGQSGNGSSITTSNIFIYGNGNIQNVNGVYGTISDLRLKENIADARNYLADLLKLRVVKYSLKEEASAVANKLGFIAQEVEQVFPAMVDTDPNDGNKGIKTSVLIPMLVKAIQELAAEVNALKNA